MTAPPAVVDCPLCGFNDWAHSFTVDRVRVRRCRNCRLSRAAPFADENSSSPSGSGGPADPPSTADSATHDLSEALLNAVERRAAPSVPRPVEGPSPLLAVVEPGHPLPELARRRGWEVEVRDIAELGSVALPPDRFRAAIVVTQIERSTNPIRSLEVIRDAMTADGVLLAVVTSLDHSNGRIAQQRWRSRPRGHLYDFNVRTLESALLRGGFGEVSSVGDVQVRSLIQGRGRDSHVPDTLLARARPATKRSRPVLSVIMPVYNEKRYFDTTMTSLLNKVIPGLDIEIIVVESNSTDGTREAVLAYEGRPRVRLVLEERPQGKGHAVRTGLKEACGDIVLIQDADCEYDFDDYEDLLKPLLTYRTAFVLGSRHTGTWKLRNFDAEPGLVSLLNFGHLVFVLLLNTLYGQKLKDPFTMYKVFRRDCLHGLRFECNRFDFDYELVIKLIRKGYTPIEIPVNYSARSWAAGKKVRPFRDPLTWLRALVKYRFAKIGEL